MNLWGKCDVYKKILDTLLLLSSSPTFMIASAASRIARRAVSAPQSRGLMTRSAPRRGHNLEDYYLWPEYNAAMVNPVFEYAFIGACIMTGVASIWPLMHSNYYFSGRFLPKDPAVLLLDESW